MSNVTWTGLPISDSYVPCRTLSGDRRRWFAFLIVSVATPFILAAPVLLARLCFWIKKTTKKGDDDQRNDKYLHFDSWVSYNASKWASDLNFRGQFLKLVGIVCAMGSLIIYWSDAANPCYDTEVCQRWTNNAWWQVDLAFNCYLLVYYALRFLGASDRLGFIFAPIQIPDYFTIPVVFVSIGLHRNWHGLRYLRIVNSLWVVDLLHRFKVIRTAGYFELARIISFILQAIVVGAGSFLLLECQGDPWNIAGSLQTGDSVTFWNYAYFSVVTISTVGYGDVGCKTILGKLFNSIFIFACLFFIASFIATAASLIPPPRRYPKADHNQFRSHIILCGHITYDTLSRFLQDFVPRMASSGLGKVFTIVLHDEEPVGDMLLLLREYQSHVEYMKGSVVNEKDLANAKIYDASAAIILTNHTTTANEGPDILRVVAIKNMSPNTRILIQTVKGSTASFLRRYPAVQINRGDVVTCKRNIINSLVGMSCMVPGFCTMAADLVSDYGFDQDFKSEKVPSTYVRGQSMTLTSVKFSPAFHGMTFGQAFEIFYTKLEMVLLAVFYKGSKRGEHYNLVPNPSADCIITSDMMGQAIAPTDHHAQLAEYFCKNCHVDSSNTTLIARCSCKDIWAASEVADGANGTVKMDGLALGALQLTKSMPFDKLPLISHARSVTPQGGDGDVDDDQTRQNTVLDNTGMFHFSPNEPNEILTVETVAEKAFVNHVIIFVVNPSPNALNGLLQILLPLRSSTIPAEKLKDILIVGNTDDLIADYVAVSSMPRIYALKGDIKIPGVIRAARPQFCSSCIILTGFAEGFDQNDSGKVDEVAVVLSLQIRCMNFSGFDRASGQPPRFTKGSEIPVITVFENESSLRFLVPKSQSHNFRATVPHMSGSGFVATQMDSLVIPAFFNPPFVKLFMSLVLGGVSPLLDHTLSECNSLQPVAPGEKKGQQLITATELVNMNSVRFSQFIGQPYSKMFLHAMKEYGCVVLGLYRLFTRSDVLSYDEHLWGADRRFVATNPPPGTILDESDKVYVLHPARSA